MDSRIAERRGELLEGMSYSSDLISIKVCDLTTLFSAGNVWNVEIITHWALVSAAMSVRGATERR